MTKKYLSGRVERTSPTGLTTDRYEYLSLDQAEPNLGDPLVGPSSIGAKGIPPGQQYIIATTGIPGERYWIPKEGGIIPGTITVYNENTSTGLVGGFSSTTQLVFTGNAINVTAPYAGPPYPPDVYIKISPPGNNGDVLFKDVDALSGLDDFATSSKLVFNSSVGILTIGNGLNVGSGGTIFTIKPTGLVGIGTSSPTQELHIQGDLRLTGTVYDFNDQPGITGDVLIKNNFGGLIWVNQRSIRAGAGGTYRNIQYHNSAGLVDGAATFVFDENNNRVGVGSTQPRTTLDVLGISSFIGGVTIDNLKVGVATIGTLGVTGLTTTKDLDVTGIATIATLGVTGLTTTRNLEVIGVSTFRNKVNIIGDLGVTGLTTTKNLNVSGIATIGTLGVTGLTTTKDLIVTGIATVGNIKIDTNTVSTTTGNLILDSILGTTQINDILYISDTTPSTSKDNGSIFTEGGVGIERNLNVGGAVSFTGSSSGVTVTLASAGGITTTGGDLYVKGDLFTSKDLYLDEIFARYGKFTEDLIVLRNVGIGTTNPGATLNVVPTATSIAGLFSGTTSSDMVRITQLGSGNALVVEDSTNPDSTPFVVNSLGNVGIGTNTVAAHKLQVHDSFLHITNSTEGSGTIKGFLIGYSSSSDTQIINSYSKPISLSTINDIPILLQPPGGTNRNVGIGTTNPISKLHVVGGAYISGISTFNGNVTLGDATSDTVTFTSRVNSAVLPSTNATSNSDANGKDLGGDSNKWRNVYAIEYNGKFIGTADKTDLVATATTTGTGSYYPTFVDTNNTSVDYRALYTDGGISYNPSSDLLTVDKIKPTQIQDSSSGTGTQNYVLTADGSGGGWAWKVASTSAGNAAIAGITIQEEGSTVGTALGTQIVNFVGDGVTATATDGPAGIATITITTIVNQTSYTCPNPITVSNGTINISSNSNAYGTRYIQSTQPETNLGCVGDICYVI